jgi:DNA end-binding protein Ku
MKAVWKGYLKCSLVTMPVKIYNAISSRPIRFHLLHQECGSPIRQEMVCPLHHRVLTNDEVVRGFQYGKDLHVVVTEADLQKAQKESSDVIQIMKFIDDQEIHPIYYADSHYLVPDGKAGAEAFALVHRVMGEDQKTALAKVVWRNKEQLLAIRPFNGVMIAFTLHFPAEIVGVQKIEEAGEAARMQIDPQGLEMARALVRNLSGAFVPENYSDEYSQTLLEIIKAKAAGQEFKVEPRAERAKVVSLMEALQKSVQETGKAGAGELPKKAMAAAGRRQPREAPKKRQRA